MNFHRLIKISLATEKGHLDRERKYLHHTKAQEPFYNNKDTQSVKIITRTNSLFIQVCQPVHDNNPLKQKVYMDLTGKFPHKLSRGNSYPFVM